MEYHYSEQTLHSAYKTPYWEEYVCHYLNGSHTSTAEVFDAQHDCYRIHHRDMLLIPIQSNTILSVLPYNEEYSTRYQHENDVVYIHDTNTISPSVYTQSTGYFCIPPKTVYHISPSTLLFLRIPQYRLLDTNNWITLRCFSVLERFIPDNAEQYPIMQNWRYHDLIDSLGIERPFVRIVFVNNKATLPTELIQHGSTVTLFPGIGGG